jgi:hypothetical protein
MKPHELAGRKFGTLTAVKRTESTRSGMSRWLCKCSCGKETIVATKHLLKGTTISCGCNIKRGKNHPQWGGCGEISGNLWDTIVRHSMARGGVPITIDMKYASDLFELQNRKCALSSVPIHLHTFTKRTASLDRIDSGQGYVPGNVQWVHKDVNRMKNVYDQDYFIETCRKIAATHPNEGGICPVR